MVSDQPWLRIFNWRAPPWSYTFNSQTPARVCKCTSKTYVFVFLELLLFGSSQEFVFEYVDSILVFTKHFAHL